MSIITLTGTSALVTWNIIIMKNFNCIITEDETWIHYELDGHQNMYWKHTTSTISKEFILWPLPGEVEKCCWVPKTLSECYRCGIAVPSARYSNMMQNELQPATHKIERGRECHRVFLCYITLHTAHIVTTFKHRSRK